MTRLTALLVIGMALAAEPSRASEGALAVVVNPGNPARALTREQVQDLFLLRRQFWDGGVRVTLVLQSPDTAEQERFLRDVLGVSRSDFETLQLQKRYRGALAARVEVVQDPEQVKALVAANRTAIGFVAASELDSRVREVFRD